MLQADQAYPNVGRMMDTAAYATAIISSLLCQQLACRPICFTQKLHGETAAYATATDLSPLCERLMRVLQANQIHLNSGSMETPPPMLQQLSQACFVSSSTWCCRPISSRQGLRKQTAAYATALICRLFCQRLMWVPQARQLHAMLRGDTAAYATAMLSSLWSVNSACGCCRR